MNSTDSDSSSTSEDEEKESTAESDSADSDSPNTSEDEEEESIAESDSVDSGSPDPSTCSLCHNTGHSEETCPEQQLDAVDTAIAEKAEVDLTAMHGVFFGLPLVGKSSLLKRMLGKLANVHCSTGVAETPAVVCIRGDLTSENATVDLTNFEDWIHMADIHQEGVHLLNYVPASKSQSDSMAAMSTEGSSNSAESMQHEVKRPVELLRECLKKKDWPRVKQMIRNPFFLYLTDSGGQPEFQQLIPTLVSGPTVFFLVFRLDKSLMKKDYVEYKDKSGKSITPYKSSRTVLETILGSLASVASMKSLTMDQHGKEKVTKPHVFLVGTFKDKVTQEHIAKVDKMLRDAVQQQDKDDIVYHASESQMIFTVDNTGLPDAEDVVQIRQAIYRLGTGRLTRHKYLVPTPYSWLVFSIFMRKEETTLAGPVVRFKDCYPTGQQYGIDSRKELRKALEFLHNRVGMCRHFQTREARELKLDQYVFRDPQYLFSKLSALIVETFTFDQVNSPQTREDFVKRGIFSAEVFEKIALSDGTIFPPEMFLCLLKYLRIIAPFKDDNGTILYFMPCALAHVEAADPSESSQPSPVQPLLIKFDCGYVPRGAFGTLVANLLQTKLQWQLLKKRIFRDQLTIRLTRTTTIVLQEHAMYFSVRLVDATLTLPDRKKLITQRCSKVREKLLSSIKEVGDVLPYIKNCIVKPCFNCPCSERSTSDTVPHLATIEEDVDGEYLRCTQNEEEIFYLTDEHSVWLSKGNGTTEAGATADSHPSKGPRLTQDDFRAVHEAVYPARQKWKDIGTRLNLPTDDIENIEEDHRTNKRRMDAVICTWLKQRTLNPSWASLVAALKHRTVGEEGVADDIETEYLGTS